MCEPNPCKNGGTCLRAGNDFDCQCARGYRGSFCHVGKYNTAVTLLSHSFTYKRECNGRGVFPAPSDCYIGDGESYRGTVSETINGDECLQWNSHFIIENGVDPFKSFQDKDGLGPHNACRSQKKNAHVSSNSTETHKRRCANEFCVIQKSRWRDHALVLLQKRTKAILGLL